MAHIRTAFGCLQLFSDFGLILEVKLIRYTKIVNGILGIEKNMSTKS